MALLFLLLGERGKLIAVLLISAAVIDDPCHFATPTQSCQEFQLVAGRDRYKDRDAALTPAAFLRRFSEAPLAESVMHQSVRYAALLHTSPRA
jgi:hypothetical protein